MKYHKTACLIASLFVTAATSGIAQENRDSIPDTQGSGKYPALKEVDSGLPGHVIYRPADLAGLGGTQLGIYIFGNGGCSDDGASSRLHLLEIASHGYVAIAPGSIYNGPGKSERATPEAPRGPDSPPATLASQLSEAIDWLLAENERPDSAYFGLIDANALAVSGFSCGGVQALSIADDPRIATGVIMNSGLFVEDPTEMAGMVLEKQQLEALHFPVLYILGGPTDVAYPNGMDDYARIEHVPVAVANIDKGHGGTYWEPNGGAAAKVVVAWLEWQLRDDFEAGAMFVGADCGLCEDPAWDYAGKRLDDGSAVRTATYN